MITRSHATQFMGQHVVLRTQDGVMHHGILHSVTNDGLYIRSITNTTRLMAGDLPKPSQVAVILDEAKTELDAQEAWFPFLFFPFFALAFLAPWAWWW